MKDSTKGKRKITRKGIRVSMPLELFRIVQDDAQKKTLPMSTHLRMLIANKYNFLLEKQ